MSKTSRRWMDSAPFDLRSTPRHDLALMLQAKVKGQDRPLTIRDMSQTGFLAESPDGLQAGQLLEVDLDDTGYRRARIVWSGGNRAGCSFEEPISKGLLSAIRLRGANGRDSAPVHQEEQEAARQDIWPVRTRLLTIVGLATLAWAMPTALAAWMIG